MEHAGVKKKYTDKKGSRRRDAPPDLVGVENPSFMGFLWKSLIVHAVAGIILSVWIALSPKAQIVVSENTVTVDMQRIEKLLEKVNPPPKPEPPKIVQEKPKPKVEPVKKVEIKKPAKAPARPVVAKTTKPRKFAQPKVETKVVKKHAVQAASLNNVVKTPSAPPSAPKSNVQATAQAKERLARSMSFLSSKPGQFNFQGAPNAKVSGQKRYAGKVVGLAEEAGGKSNILGKYSDQEVKGTVETKNSRTVSSGASYGDGKLLNGVVGRVAAASLYSGGDSIGDVFANGISLSGAGSVDKSMIEKILAKHLDKFRYCYERALLSDASLAGNMTLGWTIAQTGGVTGVNVVKSQISDRSMQSCVRKELSKIRFPAPTGGLVKVSFPFSFTSSTI